MWGGASYRFCEVPTLRSLVVYTFVKSSCKCRARGIRLGTSFPFAQVEPRLSFNLMQDLTDFNLFPFLLFLCVNDIF